MKEVGGHSTMINNQIIKLNFIHQYIEKLKRNSISMHDKSCV